MSTAPRPIAHANRDKTFCRHGHAYTPENTYWRPDGRRSCYTCRREASRRDEQRKRRAPMEEDTMTSVDASPDDGLMTLWAAFVKLCVDDYEEGPTTCRNYRTAKKFLKGTRLMDENGVIDRHGHPKQPRRTRKRTVKV